MKWTGLTGGIATGKSTAKNLIKGLGIPVIDADEISHRLSARGEEGYRGVLSHFGNEILNPDLSLDRKKLGRIIFSDPSQRTALENILHPLIQAEVKSQRRQFQESGASLCIYDVPLLYEKKLWSDFDATVLVWCDPTVQLQRAMKRDGLSAEEIALRIQNQVPLIEKVRQADFCIDNSGTLAELEIQIRKLVEKLKS